MSEENTQDTPEQTTVNPNTEVNTNTGVTDPELPEGLEELKVDELELLKQRARTLNIQFHPSIGLDKLREKINLAIRKGGPVDDIEIEGGIQNLEHVRGEAGKNYSMEELESGYANRAKDARPLTKAEIRNQAIKEATRLVRVRITCLNPNKRDWPGEIFTISNSFVGTHRKFVPFNNSEPYHIPNIILQAIQERQCQIFVNGVDSRGQKAKQARLVKEFGVEVLPPLTIEELQELKQRQLMAAGKQV